MKTLDQFYHTSSIYESMLSQQNESIYKEYTDFVQKFVPEKSFLLDAGCGVGFTTNTLSKNFKVVGSEFSQKFIERARKTYPTLKFDQGDLRKLTYADKTFDAVSSYNVVEHIEEPEKAIQEMLRITKDKGLVVIYAPNLLSPFHPLKWLFSHQDQTYDGRKNELELVVMFFRNLFLLFAKRLGISKNITPKKVILDDFFPDQDAIYYCNPVDIKRLLEKKGAKVLSYQSMEHLKKGLIARSFFYLFPNLSGSVRIVAQK